ncbi:MAG: hypothetical protein ACTSR8_07210 [Promethearchaeota archaeon]
MRISIENYIGPNEDILFRLKIREKGDKKIKSNILGVTKNRIFHFTNLKGYDRIYREIPVDKITYIENQWHDKNKILLAIGAILLLVGFIALFFIIGIVFLIAGIILIVKSMKQYGLLTINNEDWTFKFYDREAIRQIEVLIENFYNLENLSNPTNGPGTPDSDPLYFTF